MKIYHSLKAILFFMAVFFVCGHSREQVRPVHGPESFALLGGVLELLDDVYSLDANFSGEYAPCDCFSVYGDFSYRFLSYYFDTMLHDQRHELLDMRVNGFNESYLGVKLMPYSFFGVDVSWRFPPGGGSRTNRFHRLRVNPFYVYPFTRGLLLGAAVGYSTLLEDNNFQPGDELDLKASLRWRLLWDYGEGSGWQFDYAFLYRFRILESKNLNLDKPYQEMKDLDRGFRLRLDAGRYYSVGNHSLGVAFFYEMNRGNLFGAETGHTLGLYTKFVL